MSAGASLADKVRTIRCCSYVLSDNILYALKYESPSLKIVCGFRKAQIIGDFGIFAVTEVRLKVES